MPEAGISDALSHDVTMDRVETTFGICQFQSVHAVTLLKAVDLPADGSDAPSYRVRKETSVRGPIFLSRMINGFFFSKG